MSLSFDVDFMFVSHVSQSMQLCPAWCWFYLACWVRPTAVLVFAPATVTPLTAQPSASSLWHPSSRCWTRTLWYSAYPRTTSPLWARQGCPTSAAWRSWIFPRTIFPPCSLELSQAWAAYAGSTSPLTTSGEAWCHLTPTIALKPHRAWKEAREVWAWARRFSRGCGGCEGSTCPPMASFGCLKAYWMGFRD